MKKRLILIVSTTISVLINTVPYLLLRREITFSKHSFFSSLVLIVMLVQICQAYFAYKYRHKENLLLNQRSHLKLLFPDRRYKYNEYEFYWQFFVFCISIPIYIPFILFSTEFSLWPFLIPFVPFAIFVVNEYVKMFKCIKKNKSKCKMEEEELREQEKREEMGKFR